MLLEYKCKCGHKIELIVKDNSVKAICDKCGEVMQKQIAIPAFILKGDCWSSDNYTRLKGRN